MVPKLPRLEDADVAGRRVLVRADLNVPMVDGHVTDDFRVRAFQPTLEYLLDQGARAVVCSHLGRPKGVDAKYRMEPVGKALSKAIGQPVAVAEDVVGSSATALADALRPGEAMLLQNLRFEPGETSNDPALAGALASLAEVYVNDAFGASHRAHASIAGVPQLVGERYAGFLLAEEVETLGRLLDDPPRPFVVVLGGAKVSEKLGVVRNLLDRADAVLIGGGMCFTFLKARGLEVGGSLVDEEHLAEVTAIARHANLLLPTDVVVAEGLDDEDGDIVSAGAMPAGRMGLDIGPDTAAAYAKEIMRAASVFWNGPMGVFENPAFARGTEAVSRAVAACEGYTITGGGDTAAALATFGLDGEVDFMSTGGGASLEFLEGKTLPGVAALT